MNPLLPALSLLAVLLPMSEPQRGEARLLDVRRVYDAAPHSAFTDLVRFEGAFLCAFREGRGHVSSDGRLRILRSGDGLEWEDCAVVQREGLDLRDANLSVTPDGRLMLVGGAAPRPEDGVTAPTGTIVSFSNDGREWSRPEWLIEPGRWMWRAAWHLGTAYGISYSAGDRRMFLELHTSRDGQEFEPLVSPLFAEGRPTEVALGFEPDGRMVTLVRRDSKEDSAYLGLAQPPYTEWTFQDLGIHVGGPALLRLPDGRWIAGGRRKAREEGEPHRTVLYELDVEGGRLVELLELPSGGDTSYPGLVWHEDLLWVSYYSSHEERSSIYVARVALAD